jgi:hypothetical protein
MAEFVHEWTVRVITDREISEDAVNVIDDLKSEFVDAIDEVLDIENEFVEQEAQAEANATLDALSVAMFGHGFDTGFDEPIEAVAEYHVDSVPATLPEHSGSILKVVDYHDRV